MCITALIILGSLALFGLAGLGIGFIEYSKRLSQKRLITKYYHEDA